MSADKINHADLRAKVDKPRVIAITLRLDDATYERLRQEAFDQRTSITALIRSAIAPSEHLVRGEGSAFRQNPHMPSDDHLHELFGLAGGEDWTAAGLRAVWRAGCDAGMVTESHRLRKGTQG